MSHTLNTATRMVPATLLAAIGFSLAGCGANGWLGDPTKAGYYKPTATTIPVLERIDLIEEPGDAWRHLSKVTAEDLMPADLAYRIAPGDMLTLDIYGLYNEGAWFPTRRRVDQGGYYRVPDIGDVLAAGLTPQHFQDRVSEKLRNRMTHPQVQVAVDTSTGFTYTIYGGLANWGVFTLQDPDLRLLDALAQSGGVPATTETIYVIRELPISEDLKPSFLRGEERPVRDDTLPAYGGPTAPSDNRPAVDVESLIDQLGLGDTPSPDIDPTHEPMLPPQPDAPPTVLPGILQAANSSPGDELVDIDDLIPVRAAPPPPIDVTDAGGGVMSPISPDAAYLYVPERDEWVQVPVPSEGGESSGNEHADRPVDPYEQEAMDGGPPDIMLERIIPIDYARLAWGDSSFNVVVRPNDRIYVEPPVIGNVYVRGEVARPGVFQLPATGTLTLSRLITAAGGFSPIAEPERVNLTRRIGKNLEATITLNLAAIMARTEPDVVIKPDDHVAVGTSWGSTPMAIIRNGFRANYGFGFLLDRNFGNDVFGPPPRSRGGN